MSLGRVRGPGFYQLTVPLTAGEVKTLPLIGNTLVIKDITGKVKMRLDREDRFSDIGQNYKIMMPGDEPFEYLELREVNGSTANVTLLYGRGDISIDGQTIVNTLTVRGGKGFNVPAVATVTSSAAAVVAADNTRTGVLLSLPNGTSGVYIGESDVSSTKCLTLLPGGSMFLPTTDPVYARRAGAVNESLELMEFFE